MDVKYLIKFYWILLVFMIGPQVNCLENSFFENPLPRIVVHIENDAATLHWNFPVEFTHVVIEFWEHGDPQGVMYSRPCRESPACRERKGKSNVLSGTFDISKLDICCFRVTWFYNDQQVERSSCMGKENQVNPICRSTWGKPDSRHSGTNYAMEQFSDIDIQHRITQIKRKIREAHRILFGPWEPEIHGMIDGVMLKHIMIAYDPETATFIGIFLPFIYVLLPALFVRHLIIRLFVPNLFRQWLRLLFLAFIASIIPKDFRILQDQILSLSHFLPHMFLGVLVLDILAAVFAFTAHGIYYWIMVFYYWIMVFHYWIMVFYTSFRLGLYMILPPVSELEKDLQFNEEHVRNLRKNKNLILEHLNIDKLLPRLCQVGVLTVTEQYIIKHERSKRQKREIFHYFLSHKNGTTYWKFITVLQNSDQRFLTTLLEAPGLFKVCVKENIDSELLRGEKEKKEYVKASRNFKKHLQGRGNSPLIQLLQEMNVKIRWIYHGSVVYMLQFPSTKELEEFKKSYDSKIKPVIEKELSIPSPWFQKKSYMFSEISDEEYATCKQELNRLDGVAYMGWKEKLQNCQESLCDNMCPYGIVNQLWAYSLLSEKQRQKTKAKLTEYEQNEMIIDKILSMDSWHFAVFVALLDETGQEYLATMLGDVSDSSSRTDQPMSQSHKSTLRETSYILMDNLQADSYFISLMKQKKILSEYDYQRVLAKTITLDRAWEIIHILKSKSDCCFFKFGQALCETNQCHLSDKLQTCNHPKEQYRSSGRNINTSKKVPKENTSISQKMCSVLFKKETIFWIHFIFMKVIFGTKYDQLRNM